MNSLAHLRLRAAPLTLLVAQALIGCTGQPGAVSVAATPVDAEFLRLGDWRAVLTSPGGELPFGVTVREGEDGLEVVVLNAREELVVPRVERQGDELVLGFDHYDSELRAKPAGPGGFIGTWRKRTGTDAWCQMPFTMEQNRPFRFQPVELPEGVEPAPFISVAGKWKASFATSSQPGLAWLEHFSDGRVFGTVETTTGDYRYLEGSFEEGRLRLSCFDGAHAFLFDMMRGQVSGLLGKFYSRDSWQEDVAFIRDTSFELPDAFAQTQWTGERALEDLAFPDLDGELRSPEDPEFAGHVRLIQVFGTWCPNCHDEGAYLAELEERYGPRGLKIIGLAFELTDDPERNARQVRRYAKRYGLDYTMLLAGTSSDKVKATKALGALDKVRSFPTTLFVDRAGEVRAVHSGFAGPATGQAHAKLRAEFEGMIEELLAEPAAGE